MAACGLGSIKSSWHLLSAIAGVQYLSALNAVSYCLLSTSNQLCIVAIAVVVAVVMCLVGSISSDGTSRQHA